MTVSNETLDFLSRSVRFLHYWPIQELKGNSQTCSVYYFDRNQVLVRDSNNSDWIYIVLKGSLSVIKKLKRVEPQDDDAILAKRRRVYLIDSKSKKRPLHLRHSFNEGLRPKLPNHKRLSDWTSHKTGSLDSIVTSSRQSDSFVSRESSIYARIPETPDVYFRNPMELEHRLEQTLPGYHNSVDRLGSLDYDRIIQEHKTRLVQKSPVSPVKGKTNASRNGHNIDDGHTPMYNSQAGLPRSFNTQGNSVHHTRQRKNGPSARPENPHKSSFLPDIADNNKVVQTKHHNNNIRGNGRLDEDDDYNDDDKDENDEVMHDNDDDNDADDEDRLSPPFTGIDRKRVLYRKRKRISKTSKGVYLASSHDGKDRHKKKSEGDTENGNRDVSKSVEEEVEDNDDHLADYSHTDSGVKEESISEKLAKLQLQYQRRVTEGEGRKTIAEELDYKARREYKFTEADLDPTIIELQVLERGQYFGLSNILFPDQPSLSVISNGAECVVISKKFFLRLASEKCLRHLRQTESPYPSDEQLRQKLQEVVNWQAKRSSMYRSLESKILEKQAKRKQCLAYYQGQYCFRTGPI